VLSLFAKEQKELWLPEGSIRLYGWRSERSENRKETSDQNKKLTRYQQFTYHEHLSCQEY